MKSLLVALPLLTISLTSAAKMMVVSPAERAEIMKSARVWQEVNIAEKDLLNGPSDKFKLFEKVENCKFYDGFYHHVGNTGKTEKFWCLPEGGEPGKDEIKIKYNQSNGEVFAEVVSSRLLWSLGFFADRALPISVSCVNCPENPWKYLNYMAFYQGSPSSIRPIGGSSSIDRKGEQKNEAAVYLESAQKKRKKLDEKSLRETGQRYARNFEVALSEEKYKGTAVTVPDDDKAGVGFNELSKISEADGGSSKAEIDALKLLVAFIKHGDNKAANHRLVCPPEYVIENEGKPVSCQHASVVLQDVGSTMGDGALTILDISFGPTGNSKLSFDGWRKTPVWKDKKNCRALLGDNLVGGTLNDPKVSEEGRKFLADLLVQLSDQQIADMFTAARVDKRKGVKAASVQQWVELFKTKRDEIANTTCPN